MSDGYTIMIQNVDSDQLGDGMYAAWLDDEFPDSVMVRTPYLSHYSQHQTKLRKQRADYLNSEGAVVHRERHQSGYNQALQSVRKSGSSKEKTSGFKCTWYRITFPADSNFVDEVYGKNGTLRLNAIALQPNGEHGDKKYEIQWHVRKHEEVKRYGEGADDDSTDEDEVDHVQNATKGMNVRMGEDAY